MKHQITIITALVAFQALTSASPLISFDETWSAPFENVVKLISEPTSRETVDLAAKYRLPAETAPYHYDIVLHIDPNAIGFQGEVVIDINVLNQTNKIVFHGRRLQIDYINVLKKSDTEEVEDQDVPLENKIIATDDDENDDTHLITIITMDELQVGQYSIVIKYQGKYAENLLGLYVSTYTSENGKTRNLATTQFQPWHARSAFPCYDEPALKAVFDIKIFAPQGYHAISNMNLLSDNRELGDQNNTNLFSFASTVKMSTYLIAFVVSDFDVEEAPGSAEPTRYSDPFHVYFRPGQESSLDFALKFGPHNLGALENFVNFTYALPKMDKIAIPDFSAGAMENWGLVTYREEYLMWTNGISTTRNMHNVGTIISHENAHMWFGNEVTAEWWDVLWLNEGFATYFEYFGTDLVHPEWRLMDQFNVLYHQAIMLADSLPSTNAMTNPVYSPAQIEGQFNQIAYSKAGSVIKMIANVLGKDKFKKGVQVYVVENHRKTASPDSLYAALESVVDETTPLGGHSVAMVFSSWANQPGYPVVHIQRVENRLIANQKRFYQNPELSSDEEWYIPLNVATASDKEFDDTRATAWLRPKDLAVQVGLLRDDDDWFVINKQETGYYRVHYDDESWLALGVALKANNFSGIHVLNRAQIIDDSMNLARAGYLNYEVALDVVSFLENEIDYIPWVSANSALIYIHRVMRKSTFFGHLEKYILKLVTNVYNSVGYDVVADEDVVSRYNRIIALNWACSLGHSNCEERSANELSEWQNDALHVIHPDIQGVVFCTALRTGTYEDFEFLWKQYVGTSIASQRSVILSSLGCASNMTAKETLLNYSITADSGIRNQDRHAAVISVVNSGPEGLTLALHFMNDNFKAMKDHITSWSGIPNIINNVGLRLVDETEIKLFNDFVENHESLFNEYERASVESAIANSDLNIGWQTRYMPDVQRFLSGASIPGAGMLLVGILSSFLVLFNIY